jgi:AraC-like DNA-binding protein
MIDQKILSKLQEITSEEQAILDGEAQIDPNIYMENPGTEINAKKLLSDGKLITLRTHTRFVHFPGHTHDYVEVVYACSGETTHIVDGQRICLHPGELLFLGQKAIHEVCKAGIDDIAVNFIVLPEFFKETLSAIAEESSPLRQFLIDCLFGQTKGPSYLYFQVAQDTPIQNLAENLLFSLMYNAPNKRKISQMTMTLLFLELMAHTEKLAWGPREALILEVFRYVETHYVQGSLSQAAQLLHYDCSALSREIHRVTGKTYTQLVQEKRMTQAAFLLRSTDKRIHDIASSVGYENISYFHRIFQATYGMSPRNYRMSK